MNALRKMLKADQLVTAPLVFNPVMAKLAERAGFPALYLGGGSMGYVKTILEANLNVTEMCQAALEIRAACTLPLIFDAAPGFGDPMHMHRTINMSEAAGFAAIEIEDQIVPKRAHHHIGIEHMVPCELMVRKVEEAVAARRDPDFIIVARTNGIRASSMDDALKRAEAYRKAGADVLMLSPRDVKSFEYVAARLAPPLMFNLPGGGLAKYGLTLADMKRFGCRILLDPSNPFLAAYRAWKQCYESMAKGMENPGFTAQEAEEIQKDMFETIELEKLLDVERRTYDEP
jgi:2-methylisocitrate lyase-like PEP mutase family enzyme